jgi:nucleotidyltransferase substrate binding protein (TIGR01987 family)
MSNQDIRWHQRFANFNRAFAKLSETVEIIDNADEDFSEQLSDLEKEGLIQRFEYTHELAWKVMKDYIEYQGAAEIGGSRDATREAFKIGLITDGEVWMDMIKSRNLTTHTYNEATTDGIFIKIINDYFALFKAFQFKMESYRSGIQEDIFSGEL